MSWKRIHFGTIPNPNLLIPDWSLLYVVIAMVIILIVCGLVVWGVKCCVCGRRKPASYLRKKQQTANSNKPLKYSLLETNERKDRMGE